MSELELPRVAFPRIPANVQQYNVALAEHVVRRLWDSSSFHAVRTWAIRTVSTAMQTRSEDVRVIWTPHPYPTAYQVLAGALRVADPAGSTTILVPSKTGNWRVLGPSSPSTFLDSLRGHCEGFCLLVGRSISDDRTLLWSAFAALWPAVSLDDMLQVVPAFASGWSNLETGELVVDPDISTAQFTFLTSLHTALIRPDQRPPTLDWNPAGRRKGTSRLAFLATEHYIGYYEALVAEYQELGDATRAGGPSEIEFCEYLESKLQRKLKNRKFKLSKAQSKNYRDENGIPWPPRA